MELDECLKKGFIRKTKQNKKLVYSLVEMAEIKENTVKNSNLNDYNVSAYIPMAYDSLREILEGICIMLGYKVINHICIEKLLSKKYKKILFDNFDRVRYIRNNINYYGEKVDIRQGLEIIDLIFEMKKEFNQILKLMLD